MSLKPVLLRGAAVLALGLATLPAVTLPALAQSFPEPVAQTGRFRVAAEDPQKPIFPGSTVTLTGDGFVPGQEITLQRGTEALTGAAPLVADDEGSLSFEITLPEDAAVGMHPIVVLGAEPSTTELLDLKVSPQVPLSGQEGFDVTSVKSPAPGLYQVVYSPGSEALFVTAASFRPMSAKILKLDPQTLEVLAEVSPAPYAQEALSGEGGQFAEGPAAAFGIGLDEENGRIWVTNTSTNSIAVYDQADLSLVKQFPQGQVYHSREVLVDADHGRAYVTSSATAKVHVFDTQTLEPVEVIEIDSSLRGGNFYVMNLVPDAEGKRIFVSSRATSELAVIDAESGAVTAVHALPGMIHATGLAYDAQSGMVWVAGQGSDDVMVVDPESGEVLHEVAVGAGALSLDSDGARGLAWVANRGAGTLTAVSAEGEILANLEIGSYPNDVTVAPDGTVYAVNKSFGAEDEAGDLIWAIRRK
ncbi:YncE family protein [Pseudooceanicola sp. HF7]|uniref:YncE family protein n=1 Tax=Pseudooceanicola sp. HF7 TaxID=2721560 RepID=UPI00143004B8|nr:YncE family protein [Pseudooceanicola sp. HF7]NIZ11346.1 YncE family protein [Pseudooceanicola sp. HF7]